MRDDAIRFGVIGLGAIAPSHIHAIKHTPGAELAAVCDVRADAARQFGEQHGVPHYEDVAEMVSSGLIDAATVGTPSGYHLDPVGQVLQGGKHVLVEKPIEITTARIDELLAAEAESNGKMGAVFQSRFNPLMRKLHGLIGDGLLGEIYTGSANIKRYRTQEYYDSGAWRGTWEVDGGGCLMNQGIHTVDLFVWFMGQVKEVIAVTSSMGRDVEVETLAHALVEFAGGARGVVTGTTLAYPEYESTIEVIGSRGTCLFSTDRLFHMDLSDPTEAEAEVRTTMFEEQRRREAEAARKPKETVAPGTAVGSVDMGHTPVVEDFVEAIREDRAPFVNGAEGRRSVELITGIYESARNGSQAVRF